MKKNYILAEHIQDIKDVVQEISNIVTSTMGPMGRTNILFNGIGTPHVTKDGVTVAEFLKYDEPFKETINRIIKETARSTGHKVGDGTTTSILLATELIMKMLPLLNQRSNIRESLEILQHDIKEVTGNINKLKKDLSNFDSDEVLKILKSVVNLSSNGDTEVVNLIMGIIEKIGPNGLIDVVEVPGEDTYTEIQDGMLIEAPAYVTSVVDVSKPYIAIVANSIEKVHEFKTFMVLANRLYLEEHANIIVIAKDFSQEIQNIVTINNRNNKFKVYLAESDGFGFTALDILDDMAMLLKCKVLSTDQTSPFGLQNVELGHLAKVKSATLAPGHTILYNDLFLDEEAKEIKEVIEFKIAELKRTSADSVGELQQLQRRLNKFSKSASIKVGGMTEADRKERKDRIDDAVQALNSAVNNGVVPGAGYALYIAAKPLHDESNLKNICELPFYALCKNAEIEGVTTILESYDKGNVIDFLTMEVGDPYKLGVLDPADVPIKAMQQALAIVKAVIGSYSVLIDIEDGEV